MSDERTGGAPGHDPTVAADLDSSAEASIEASTAEGLDAAGSTPDDTIDPIADAQAAIDDARRRVAEAPPEIVVTNHVMGLYELAAIHLSADEPNLPAAALAIDAVACLVDGLGDRLGPDVSSLRDALANIRLAFVQIKSRAQDGSPAPEGS